MSVDWTHQSLSVKWILPKPKTYNALISLISPCGNKNGLSQAPVSQQLLSTALICFQSLVKLPEHVEPFALMALARAAQQHSNRYWKRMLQYILAARPVYSPR